MKKDSGKIAVLGVLSLLVAIGTLIGAAVLAHINSKNFSATLPDNNYSADEGSSEQSENGQSSHISSEESTSSEQTASNEEATSSEESPSGEEGLPEEIVPSVETGLYASGEDSIVIISGEAGFVEGNINCGGVTMEFSGQTVDNRLVATGIDSLNNTVEVTLVFDGTEITASSRPIIQYEEASDYLTLSGIFIK